MPRNKEELERLRTAQAELKELNAEVDQLQERIRVAEEKAALKLEELVTTVMKGEGFVQGHHTACDGCPYLEAARRRSKRHWTNRPDADEIRTKMSEQEGRRRVQAAMKRAADEEAKISGEFPSGKW